MVDEQKISEARVPINSSGRGTTRRDETGRKTDEHRSVMEREVVHLVDRELVCGISSLGVVLDVDVEDLVVL